MKTRERKLIDTLDFYSHPALLRPSNQTDFFKSSRKQFKVHSNEVQKCWCCALRMTHVTPLACAQFVTFKRMMFLKYGLRCSLMD